MTTESLAKPAPSSRPPALSQRPELHPTSTPTQGKTQRPWVAQTLPISQSLLRSFSIGRPLLTSLFPSIRVGGSSAKTITEQQRSQALPVRSLHQILSSLRLRIPHLKSRNGRSRILLARDGRARAMNTRCAGEIHGCPGGNWGTPSGCCRSLRRKAERTGAANGAKWLMQTKASDCWLLCSVADNVYIKCIILSISNIASCPFHLILEKQHLTLHTSRLSLFHTLVQ